MTLAAVAQGDHDVAGPSLESRHRDDTPVSGGLKQWDVRSVGFGNMQVREQRVAVVPIELNGIRV